MAFRYLKYLTDYGNTIVAESPTPFILGPGEGQIFTNFEIPAIQPLYLYAESGGNVIVNSDPQINAYLASIGEEPFDSVFTGYTATTEQRLSGIESNVIYLSGETALRLRISDFNVYSGATLSNINSRLKITDFNVYSAATLTNINSRLLTSNFNTYSANTQTQINGKLNITDFNVYSAATLSLIQSSQSGLDPKQSVFVATTAPLGGGATYSATGGTAGTGSFTSAPTTIDGRTLSNGKRVLVKNQVDARQNGIYVVISSGVWHRAPDQNGVPATNISAGNYTFIETGTTNIGSGWVVIGNGQLTVNVDNIVWTQFNASTGYVQGVGILITGNTISFNGSAVAGNSLTWNGTQLNVDPTTGTLATALAAKLDKTVFNTFTGTTAPATYLSIANFNSYSAATQTQINNKLNTSDFNTYSANTANILNTKVDSANNGLTKVGRNIHLGGTLTGTTNIGLGSFNLILTGGTGTLRYGSDLSAQYNVRSLVDKGYVTGITSTLLTISAFNVYSAATLTNINSRLLTSAFNTYSGNTANLINTKIGSANNGLTKSGTNVHLGGTLTGATTIGLGTVNLTLTGTTGTLRYGSDLSAQYNVRSVVDKGYVTGITSTLLTKSSFNSYTASTATQQILLISTGTTDLNQVTPTTITWHIQRRYDTTYFLFTGGTNIRILSAGNYDISYQINLASANAAAKSLSSNVYVNGSAASDTLASTYTQSNNAVCSLVLGRIQKSFAANDLITLRGYRILNAGAANTVPNSVFISITKKV